MKKQLFIFDLDFTLWHLSGTWCDCTFPPYRKKNGIVVDSTNAHMNMYPETVNILQTLKDEGYPLAVASRTDQPPWAKELMKLLRIDHFFDDEYRNIAETKELGVNAVLVKNGITSELVEKHKQ